MSNDFTVTWEEVVSSATSQTNESRRLKTEILYKHGDFLLLAPNDLQLTAWNPQQRTQIDESQSSSMGILLNGIIKFRDLIIPVIIDACGNLIEGNRRVVASRWLISHGVLPSDFKLPCFVRQFDGHSSEEVYAWVNYARKQITNSVALEIYLKSEQALVDKVSSKSAYFVRFIGGVEKATEFSRAGGTLIYLKAIETLATFTGLEPYTIGMWLVRYKLRHKTKKMVGKLSRELLIKLITQNKYPRF
jgi:hypothetical protein